MAAIGKRPVHDATAAAGSIQCRAARTAHAGVIGAPMDTIIDRVGTTYTVTRSPLQADGTVIYHAFNGNRPRGTRRPAVLQMLYRRRAGLKRVEPSARHRLVALPLDRGRARPTAAAEQDQVSCWARPVGYEPSSSYEVAGGVDRR